MGYSSTVKKVGEMAVVDERGRKSVSGKSSQSE